MPVTKPTDLPRWSEELGGTQHNITPAPSSGRKDVGWLPDDEVLAQWLNWWMNLTYRWIVWLDGLTDEVLTWTAAQTFSARATFNNGILVNAPSTSNRPGIDSTGNGTAPGVLGRAANNAASAGVEGIGNGSAPGIRGTAGNTSSAALFTGDTAQDAVKVDASAGTGACIVCVPNSTSGTIALGAIAGDPSSPADGETWYNSSTNKFRGRANGVSVDFH